MCPALQINKIGYLVSKGTVHYFKGTGAYSFFINNIFGVLRPDYIGLIINTL